jgi:hypothetical protein
MTYGIPVDANPEVLKSRGMTCLSVRVRRQSSKTPGTFGARNGRYSGPRRFPVA